MKALSASIVALVLAAAPIVCSPAGADKMLQNQEGTVTYGTSATPTTKLAKNGQIALNDNDYAATAANSKATITLPDSSVVTMGQNSSVQMVSFDDKGIATAKFKLVGKVRFQVNHPTGAQANYTFQTPTGQIAVRGTIGDIASLVNSSGAPAGLQVNVYALTSANLPVQVTLVNGQIFTLAAGQSLVVSAAATGALVGSVGAVSNTTFAPFSQLGAPANAGSLGITSTTTTAAAGSAATGAATGATAAATTTAVAAGTVGAVAATTAIANSGSTATATPTPTIAPTPTATPTPSSTSVPITISGGHASPAPAPTMAPPAPIMPHPIMPPHPPGGRPSPHP